METNSSSRSRVTSKDLKTRLHEHVYTSYLNYSFFIKGAVVGAASLALIGIFRSPSISFQCVRLVLWCASIGFSVVTIATWNRGSVFTGSRANYFDLLAPFLVGIAEMCMFLVLANSAITLPNNAWQYWYAALSAHSSFAVILINNRKKQARKEDYEESLHQLYDLHMTWLKSDRRGATTLSLMATIILLLTLLLDKFPSILDRFQVIIDEFLPTRCLYIVDYTTCIHLVIGCALTALSICIARKAMRQHQLLAEI